MASTMAFIAPGIRMVRSRRNVVYNNGRLHGLAKQWNAQGVLLGTCKFQNGKVLLGFILRRTYSEIIPIVLSHFSTNAGHSVIGNFVVRSPKPCPPSAYKCSSTGTLAFLSARE